MGMTADEMTGKAGTTGTTGHASRTREPGTPVRFRVVGIEDGMMLRQLLGKRLKLPPNAAAEIVRAGGAYVGPVRICVPTLRVTEGERVTVYPEAGQVAVVQPEALALLHRDENCVIVDKPHGVPAAATKMANRGTLAQALVLRLTQEGVLRPYVGVVHALPPAAAGLVLYTIRSQTTGSFYKEFAAQAMRRSYRVRLRGSFVGDTIACEAPIVHSPVSGCWRLARAKERAPVAARTVFRKLAELGEETLAAVDLADSPTDAIRLHASALGLPVVGDGESEAVLCLLAETLAFTQPRSGAAIFVRAALPIWAALPGEAPAPELDAAETSDEAPAI